MMLRLGGILALLIPASCLMAQVSVTTTATQAVLHYTAPDQTACQVQVSTSSTLTPLVNDVNPVLFSGANLDSRPGSAKSASGLSRYFVVGTRRADVAADGKRYSRALQAFSTYNYSVTCGASGTSVQTGQFTTLDPPLGNNYPETPPFDSTAFGNYSWPTIDWNDQTKVYVDPMTGIALKRATAPGWYGNSQTARTFAFAVDLNGVWTSPTNILSGNNTTVASYSGLGGDPVFVSFDPAQMVGFSGTPLGGWSPNQATMDNVLVRVFGTGTGIIDGCLTDDSTHCVSPALDLVTLGQTGGNPAGTYPSACATDSSTGCFPNNGFWGGWSYTPVGGQFGVASGTVNVSGTAVTASTPVFNIGWKQGSRIYIAGSSPTCPGNLCTISSVTSSTKLTITQTLGTLSGAAFKSANSGVLLWVKKTSGTVTASISANLDYSYSDQFQMPANGSYSECSPNPTTVSFAADGVTAITPVSGELCLASHTAGPAQALYLLIPSTGETRFLAPIWFVNSSDAAADQLSDPVMLRPVASGWDATDPNTFYAQAKTAGGMALFKAVYNASTNNYKTYSHSLYPSASASYQPGQDTTQNWYRGPAWSNTGLVWTNITKASAGMDLSSQIVAADPNWNPTLFQTPNVTQAVNGLAYVANSPMSNAGPESITLIHTFTLATGTLSKTADTWRTFPNRWCAMHSSVAVGNWYGLICNPLGGALGFTANPGIMGVGPWQMTPTAMLKSGSFSADTSMTTAAPRDKCPAIPTFLQSWVPSTATCVTFQSRMACSLTPYPGENTKWPCGYNSAYSELQPLAPGDDIMVNNGTSTPEFLMILTVTSLGSANYQFTAARATSSGGYQAAATKWTGYAMPPTTNCNYPNCTPGVGLWLNGPASTVSWLLDPGAFAAHSDLGNGPTSGSNTYCQTFTCRYNVPMSQQIGSFTGANTFKDGSFGGTTGAIATQGYPSVHQLNAPATEQVWMANFRHINPSFGSGPEVVSDVGSVTYSLVSGTQTVYKFTSVNGGVNYKYTPVAAYAGRNLLHDASSPTKGNTITDSTPWLFCVVYLAGECQTGSKVGEVYASVPKGVVSTTQNCEANWYDDNYPCVFTPPPPAAFAVQQEIDKNDAGGANWRRITMGLSGYGRQFQFGTFIPDPTGAWGFIQGYWLDGVRNDLLMARFPSWPTTPNTTINRSTFVNQAVTVPATSGYTGARIRFGYAENGSATGFYCTGRQEACVTGGTPYSFLSENPAWQACAAGCTIQIPAISGRTLYYVIDRQSGSTTVSGDTQVLAVQ